MLHGNLTLFNSFDTKCLCFTSPRMRNVGGNTVSWGTKTFVCLLSTFVRHYFFLLLLFLAPKKLVVYPVNGQQKWRFSRILLLFSFSGRAEPGDEIVKSRYSTWCYVQWNVHSLTSWFFFSYAGYCWFVRPGGEAASSSASLVQSPKKVTIEDVEFFFIFFFFISPLINY